MKRSEDLIFDLDIGRLGRRSIGDSVGEDGPISCPNKGYEIQMAKGRVSGILVSFGGSNSSDSETEDSGFAGQICLRGVPLEISRETSPEGVALMFGKKIDGWDDGVAIAAFYSVGVYLIEFSWQILAENKLKYVNLEENWMIE